jgi:hypothetical protein
VSTSGENDSGADPFAATTNRSVTTPNTVPPSPLTSHCLASFAIRYSLLAIRPLVFR